MMTSALTEFRRDGFTEIPAFIPASQVRALQTSADDLITSFTERGYRSEDFWFFERPSGDAPVLYRVHNLERQGSPVISSLFAGGPLHGLAADILGAPVRSTACAMIVKLPYVAAAVPWHRDRTSVPAHTVCNLSVFLDRSADNGCLEFVAGSHLLPDAADVAAVSGAGPATAVPAQAGDVVVHDVRAVHGSRPNGTATIRRSIVIEFAPAGLSLPRDG